MKQTLLLFLLLSIIKVYGQNSSIIDHGLSSFHLDDGTIKAAPLASNVNGEGYTLSLFYINDGQEILKSDFKNFISVFPNPASTSIRFNESINNIRITDLNGRILYHGEHLTKGELLDIATYPEGTYLLFITQTNNSNQTIKLIKSK